jgi:hypothetical protein
LGSALSTAERGEYLKRGAAILAGLKTNGRLLPNQDHTAWFAARLAELEPADQGCPPEKKKPTARRKDR